MVTKKQWFNAVVYGIIAILLIAVIGVIVYMFRAGSQSLPEGGQAPNFTAMNLKGQPVSLNQSNGKIRIVTWYYTHCTDECPLTMYRLEQLQSKLKQQGKFGNDVVLIAMTLDPKNDTRPVIAKYSSHYHADHSGWYFLRANPTKTTQILKSYGIQEKQLPDTESIEHTLKTELIDQNGNIRKTYTTANLSPNQMMSDINNLLARKNWLHQITGS